MAMDTAKIYQKVLDAQLLHNKFLNATEKNLSYYFFGKQVTLVKNLTFPQVDLVEALSSYTPEAYNPLAYFISGFIDEIANSGFVVNVSPYPVSGKEPYEAFANQIEDHLQETHRISLRNKYIRAAIFEFLAHGYFGIYTNGSRYWFLTAYDLFPGDGAISDFQSQPFWVRKTAVSKASLKKIYKNKSLDFNLEGIQSLDIVPDLDNVTLYDTWVKDLDANICFTSSGQVLYNQKFPYPKEYPFFGANDSDLINSFYTKPLISSMRPLLEKHQDSLKHIEESGKSIATPILTYDADAGIDVNALLRALKEGYKKVIVGKNREGDLKFHAPGHLPNYALDMPNIQLNQMMKHLGISESFFGMARGIRERGALGRLIKTSFRKLGRVAAALEETFTDLDSYLIDYLRNHQFKVSKEIRYKDIEQVFGGDVSYRAKETFRGFGTEDTLEARNLAMIKWKTKMIPQEEALRELGHNQPRKLIDLMREEAFKNQELVIKLKQISGLPSESILDRVNNRLKGRLKFRYYLSPIADDKILIRSHEEDQRMIAFLLSDISSNVLIESSKVKERLSPEQEKIEIEKEEKKEDEEEEEKPEEAKLALPALPETKEETRGRPREKIITPPEILKQTLKKMLKKEELPKEERISSPPFSEERLKELVARRHTIKNPEKFFKLPGLYIVEPHARWIFSGKKTLLLKARKFGKKVDKMHLLCGKEKVYGLIIIRDILENFDFEKTRKYHLVTPAQAKGWWKSADRKLYLYLFEFHPFAEPIDYDRPQGVQTFLTEVKVKREMGMPQMGDLKPVAISGWKIPPPHKPEKRAFKPQEVFSLERLQEIIPEATYDVSEKIDGLRCISAECPLIIKNSDEEIRIGYPNRIKVGSEVLTHKGHFKKITKIYKRNVKPSEENIYELKNHALAKFKITGNHPILDTNGNWICLDDFKWNQEAGSLQINNSKREKLDKITLEYQGYIKEIPLNSDTLWLMGFWVAEGSNYLGGKKINGRIVLANKDKEKIARVKWIIETYLKVPTSIYISRYGVIQLYFLDLGFSKYLADNFKAENHHEKTIPIWISQITSENFRSFLKGWQDGDGDLQNDSITTSSPYAAARLVMELTRFGIPYSFGQYPTTHKIAYCIYLNRKERITFRNKKKIHSVKNAIPVWNFEVEEDHSYVTPNLCLHNCFAWVHGQEARLFSDVGGRFPDERVRPLLRALKKIFRHDVLIDGELVMEGIRRKDVAGYIHAKWKPTSEQLSSLRYICWDVLYVKDKSIAAKPFSVRSSVLDLYLKKGCRGLVCRVRHLVVNRKGVSGAVKKLQSPEGAMIRDVGASYWATHSTYKMKYQFDVDARVFAVAKTKVGLPIFFCELRDGTYIGQSYAQSEIKARAGDVIRMNIDHVSILPDGRVNWYAPKPRSWKEGKITPKKISTTQVGIGGPDNIDLIKEIYLATGGQLDRWEKWLPLHKEWKAEKMSAFKETIKRKIREGVEVSKI